MQVQKAIQKRLSIRRYADASIPDEHLDILIKALQLAASGNNYQNWEFVFVKDEDIRFLSRLFDKEMLLCFLVREKQLDKALIEFKS